MDLGSVQQVGGVVTQGRHDKWGPGQYVKSYQVKTSVDGKSWSGVDSSKTFQANKASSDEKITNTFKVPVKARWVRIIVKTWNIIISMRAAVLSMRAVCTASKAVKFDVDVPLKKIPLMEGKLDVVTPPAGQTFVMLSSEKAGAGPCTEQRISNIAVCSAPPLVQGCFKGEFIKFGCGCGSLYTWKASKLQV